MYADRRVYYRNKLQEYSTRILTKPSFTVSGSLRKGDLLLADKPFCDAGLQAHRVFTCLCHICIPPFYRFSEPGGRDRPDGMAGAFCHRRYPVSRQGPCLAYPRLQFSLKRGNIERAFRYIDISLADALFYNAKLRPWQVAGVLPQIKSLSGKTGHQARRVKTFLISISGLLLILILAIGYLIRQTRRTIRAHKSLRGINKRIVLQNSELNRVNDQLQKLNRQIAESTGKEGYIGLFWPYYRTILTK